MLQDPIVHLNGTSAQALADGYQTAGAAVSRALESVQDAAPNARDYYPLGDAAWAAAQKEHMARVDALRKVYEELRHLFEYTQEEANKRVR